VATARQDDPSISGNVRLWRRIPNRPKNYKFDEKLNRYRPTSINFRDQRDELSVNLADESKIAKILEGHSGFLIVEFTAGLAREILDPKVVICRDPEPDNPGHALICVKVSGGQSEKLAKKCRWVIEPVELSQASESAHDPVDPGTMVEALRSSPVQGRIWTQGFSTPLLVLLLTLIAVVIALFLFRN